VNGIDAAISKFGARRGGFGNDNPAWATDLLFGDHFIFGTSGLAAGPGYPIVQVPAGFPSFARQLRNQPSARNTVFHWESASSGRPLASPH